MHHQSLSLALSSLALISSTSAIPLLSSPPPLRLPNGIDCSDVTTGLDPSCWNKLNMTGWMKHWYTTTPGVVPPQTSSQAGGNPCDDNPFDNVNIASSSFNNPNCQQPAGTSGQLTDPGFGRRAAAPAGCQKGELWSTCFLRLGLGKSGQDCSVMGKKSCDVPVAGQPPHTPQIFYGIWNIYAVNAYFYALDLAFEVLIHDPKSQSLFRTALTTSSPTGQPIDLSPGKSYPVDSALARILQKETDGAFNKPLIAYLQKYTSNNEYDSKTSVDDAWNSMYYIMHNALTDLMTDEGRFLEFVGSGAFSTGELPTRDGLLGEFGGK